jgi:hypothetical protein
MQLMPARDRLPWAEALFKRASTAAASSPTIGIPQQFSAACDRSERSGVAQCTTRAGESAPDRHDSTGRARRRRSLSAPASSDLASLLRRASRLKASASVYSTAQRVQRARRVPGWDEEHQHGDARAPKTLAFCFVRTHLDAPSQNTVPGTVNRRVAVMLATGRRNPSRTAADATSSISLAESSTRATAEHESP